MKASKQIIIDAIIKEIEQGKTYTKVMAVNGRKWQMPERTFNRYWKTANEQHIVKQQEIKKELAEVDKQAAIEARKKAIMTANERKELLTKLINGEIKAKRPFVIGGKIMEYPEEPTHRDRISAIAELNKMEGDYAPTKIAQTDKHGNDIKQKTDEELQKRLSFLQKIK